MRIRSDFIITWDRAARAENNLHIYFRFGENLCEDGNSIFKSAEILSGVAIVSTSSLYCRPDTRDETNKTSLFVC